MWQINGHIYQYVTLRSLTIFLMAIKSNSVVNLQFFTTVDPLENLRQYINIKPNE